MKWINDIRDKANNSASSLEPWKNYFDLRALEMETLLSLFDMQKKDRVLEIGCGNGFNSCILSQKAKSIVATDLFWEDNQTHSQGMEAAKRLMRALHIDNCDLLACSGEDLPFGEGSFDMVFSMYTLEHVPDRKKMLLDVKRVLKKDGLFIAVVPSFMERVIYLFVFYTGLASILCSRIFSKTANTRKGRSCGPEGSKRSSPSSGTFRQRHPHFPFPEPHGSYDNYFKEVSAYRPKRWERLFKESGMEIVDVFSSMVVPKSLLDLFLGKFGFPAYKRLSWIDERIGKNSFLKNFGQNICFVLRKG